MCNANCLLLLCAVLTSVHTAAILPTQVIPHALLSTPELLARVLGCLTLTERLQFAALVSKAWHTAAVMATSEVRIPKPSSTSNSSLHSRCNSLSSWLQHSNAVTSIRVGMTAEEELTDEVWGLDARNFMPHLQLPVQLKNLRTLSCAGLLLTAAPGAGSNSQDASIQADTAAPKHPAPLSKILTPSLSRLTFLKLSECSTQFDGLACLTGLRVLSLSPLVLQDNYRQLQGLSAIAEALPKLQRLSQLRLRGPAATDTVLKSIKDLMGLRHLVLRDARCTEASLQDLPVALHHLTVCCRDPSSAAGLSISPHSTPGFCMLDNLKSLHLDFAGMFDTSVLRYMTQLCTFHISATPLTAPAGQGRFQGLPELSDIRLNMEGVPRDITEPLIPEEAAALTASTSLTELELSDDYMGLAPEPWHALFPPGRQLRALSSFTAGTGLLSSPEAMQLMAASCQQLTALSFICAPDLQQGIVDPGVVATGLQHLTTIPSLQRLTIVHEDLPLATAVVNALAALTHLAYLQLVFQESPDVNALMKLTGCRQLQGVDVDLCDPASDPSGVRQSLALHVAYKVRGLTMQPYTITTCLGSWLKLRCAMVKVVLAVLPLAKAWFCKHVVHSKACRHRCSMRCLQDRNMI